MPQYEVTIKAIPAYGHINFTYQPSVLHACAGDTVVWTSEDGPFAIEFKEDTPGPDIGTHGNQVGGHWESAQFQIRQGARGHYHYAVAVVLANDIFETGVKGRVALDAACPEIIVN
jgi:plastocyanin